MALHFTESAALTDLPAAKKLVLMACADSADKDTRIALPGFDTIQQWSGLKRSQAYDVIAELVEAGFLARRSSGRAGRRAEFYVFPRGGCCPLHAPLPDFDTAAEDDTPDSGEEASAADETPEQAGSGGPDPESEVQRPAQTGPSTTTPGSGRGSGSGSGLDRTPSRLSGDKNPPTPASGGNDQRCEHGTAGACRRCGTNPRAVAAQAAEIAAAEVRRRRAEREAAARAATAAAIAACPRCDADGYVHGRVCDHDPATPARATRGVELCRDAVTRALADRRPART